MEGLIRYQRSVIPACDVSSLSALADVVIATHTVHGIGAYKVGAVLTITFGLPAVVETVRRYTDLPVIHDHQKGGTDIPDLGPEFAKAIKAAGADAFILFPLAGKVTEETWIRACQDVGLYVLVGGHMTQKGFLVNEGGFILDPPKIYRIAAQNGVCDFVVPGNKPEFVSQYRQQLEGLLGVDNFVLYAPGFIAQGGKISEARKAAGKKWHAIVGSAIYKAGSVEAMNKAAQELVSEIV